MGGLPLSEQKQGRNGLGTGGEEVGTEWEERMEGEMQLGCKINKLRKKNLNAKKTLFLCSVVDKE